MSRLKEDLQQMRAHIKKMRPEACCRKGIMHLSGGRVELSCTTDCQWQELDRILATVMVDASIESKD